VINKRKFFTCGGNPFQRFRVRSIAKAGIQAVFAAIVMQTGEQGGL